MNVYTISAQSLSPGVLNDASLMRSFIDQLADEIQMTIVNGPTIHAFERDNPKAGLSGFAIIAESHVSIHTWPESCWVNLTVVSCRDFEPERVHGLLADKYDIKQVVDELASQFPVGPYETEEDDDDEPSF